MFLHHQPAIAAFFQGFDVLIQHIGMIGQVLFWGRKTFDSAEGFDAEDGGKMLLPCLNLQLEVGSGRRRHNSMALHRPQPFDIGLILFVASNPFEVV